ncbi:TPA: hypothetical protein EYO57_35665 [Candidatus Poribacteria bacterium]|nr:hypothetical protein [Candidatus Poribacteria bacterium]
MIPDKMSFFRKQKDCLEQRTIAKDAIVFCTFIEGIRHYSSVADHDEYARYILSEESGSDFCNELLWSDTHSYCDLDCPHTLQALGFTQTEFVEAFSDLLVSSFDKHLGVAITPNDCIWSCSTREGKTSYHVKISSNAYYWPVSQRKTSMKTFWRLVNEDCLNTKGFHFYQENEDDIEQLSILDLSVCSANRCFRSLNCKKFGIDVRFLPLDGRVNHSTVVNHMLTVSAEGRKSFELKSKCKLPPRKTRIHTGVLRELAAKHGAEYVNTVGSLVKLRNVGCRTCLIGNEENQTDHCFFVLKDHAIFFGCHNAACQGTLLRVHELRSPDYEHYEDYFKLIPAGDFGSVCKYMKSCIKWVDRTSEPFFVTTSKLGLACYDHRLHTNQVNFAKTLFKGYADIHLQTDDEPIKFSKVLGGLMKQRMIPTYSDVLWLPYSGPSPPIPKNKLNTFQGFALASLPPNEINFEETKTYDLLKRLCGNQTEYISYLCSFLSCKLNKPYIKLPICLCFINSKEGSGKGTFGNFLEKLYCCGENTYVSFNNLDSFTNGFNGIQARALWICLEEVSARKGGLKAFNGLLKDKISSQVLLCEVKNKERVQIPWYASIIIFSNEFNVLSVSKNDRRLVCFKSDSSKANDKDYFVAIHKELSDLKHMRAAWDYFKNYDTSQFNYREIPQSDMKDALVNLCAPNAVKFHHWFMKQYGGREEYTVAEPDIYESYRAYVQNYGMHTVSNRHTVIAQLELHCEITRTEDGISFTDIERRHHI